MRRSQASRRLALMLVVCGMGLVGCGNVELPATLPTALPTALPTGLPTELPRVPAVPTPTQAPQPPATEPAVHADAAQRADGVA